MSRNRTKRRGGIGTFFFGSFIGFMLCLGLLIGGGCLIYFNVSPNWINKTFKTSIDLGSDVANKKTLNDLVTGAVGLISNINNYKLANLKKDFGIDIGNKLFGLDISDLKEVQLKDLASAIGTKLSNISADELKSTLTSLESDMGHLLNQTITYYYNDGLLYKDSTHSTLVTFDYKLDTSENTITTKGHITEIQDNKAKIPMWFLPLTDALGDFTASMGENVTLKQLEDDFGVNLFFLNNNRINKENVTVNQLESVMNLLYVGDLLGYTITVDGETVTSVKNGETEVTGLMGKIAKCKVNEINGVVNILTLEDVFGNEQPTTGALSLLTETEYRESNIETVMDKLMDKVTSSSINTLHSKGILTIENESTLSITVDHDNNSATPLKAVGELNINQFINYCLNSLNSIS